MKKGIICYPVVLLLIFIASCNGQKDSGQLSNQKDEVKSSTLLSAAQHLPDYDPYFIETTTTSSLHGPKTITRNILQDQKENIWFATWEGIMHYDGKRFTNYTNKEGLRRWHVFSILEDRSRNVWFGTIGAGLYRYNPNARTKQFTNFTTNDGLVHDRVGCFYQDKKGTIWIGTEGGISLYHSPFGGQKEGDQLFRNLTTEDGLTNNDVNSIVEDKNGRIWIGTRGEACYYENGKFTRILNSDDVPFINVRSIIEDNHGNIWLGGNDGLWCYNPKVKNSSRTRFTKYNSNFVGYIYEDQKGSIWTSSTEANSNAWVLSRYDRASPPLEGFVATKIKTQDGQLFGITQDIRGNIWIGHERGTCRLSAEDMMAGINDFDCFIE